ncbi:hypothetical protein TELCIR_25046 [Teladorsagia circumcincta]|uniref:Uncharacterized protein n=1 Tax=Teladorsagia circumcincta TaxID=45464 RepID=A0A2G9T6P3_TELCI|nr:hypothetical protein TELCIR_25046 [Teladorsagia circumcincta]
MQYDVVSLKLWLHTVAAVLTKIMGKN